MASVGATIMGRRMFDTGEEPWGDNPPFPNQVFVLTNLPREPLVRLGGTTFTFVTDGIERAMELARVAAGGQDISVAGGAETIQRMLKADLLDERLIHLSTILLGAGTRLLEAADMAAVQLAPVDVHGSADVTHIRYRSVRPTLI